MKESVKEVKKEINMEIGVPLDVYDLLHETHSPKLRKIVIIAAAIMVAVALFQIVLQFVAKSDFWILVKYILNMFMWFSLLVVNAYIIIDLFKNRRRMKAIKWLMEENSKHLQKISDNMTKSDQGISQN